MTKGYELIDLDALIRAAGTLDPLPASVTRIAAIVAAPGSSLAELADAVALDQALTLRVLRLANTAAVRGRTAAHSARDAVMRLGMGTVLALATAGPVRADLSKPLPRYGLREGELWRHSVTSALAIDAIRSMTSAPLDPAAFTAALLHDVGKLVLARFLSEEINELLESAPATTAAARMQLEREVLGVHHAEVGALIAQSWELPKSIEVGVTYHHDPEAYANTLGHDPALIPLCHAVHLAEVVAHACEPGASADLLEAELSPTTLQRLGLAADRLAALTERVGARLGETLTAYGA